MRKFERISFNQFKKDIGDDKELYYSIELPKRSTKYSAGYDLRSLEDYTLESNTSHIFKTGLKVLMNEDEALLIIDRSSFGYKYDVTLSNSIGLIDSDYYNNESNEGHFSVKLINHGKESIHIKKKDKIAQAIFIKYLCVEDEEENNKSRTGGFGSTGKED